MKSILAIVIASLIAIGSNTACPSAKAEVKNEVENNKQMARIWFEEVFVKENLVPLDTIVHENATMTMDPSYPSKVTGTNKLTGIKEIKEHVKNYTSAADTTGNVKDIVGEGNTVVLFRTVTMKTPQGTAVDVPWVTIFKFKNGKISEITHVHDTLHEKNQTAKK